MSDRIIRLGILGPGGIVSRVSTDFARFEGLEITAVASRSLERAQEAAARYGASYAYGSYEELAESDKVDLIYIATPHNFHMDQAILCMENGKHVLCEKPMALNDMQVERMISCARRNNVFLMEAMWTRLFPASYKIRELIKQGTLGKIWHVSSDFSFYFEPNYENRLLSMKLAGGALLDVGIYTMAASTMVLGYDHIKRVDSSCMKAETGVDMWDSITMTYDSGATAHQQIGFCATSEQTQIIMGDKARLVIPDFWHPTRFTMIENDGTRTEFTFEAESEGFRHEFMHVRQCILDGMGESPIMPLEETLALSQIMTRLRREWGVIYPEEA